VSAHTPGPWRLDIGTGTIWAVRGTSFDGESELVERVATMRPTCGTDRWSADAHMITSAPELVEAHRWITDLASGWDEDGALGPKAPLSWETVARMAMDYARAAIAKAEGR